MNTINEAMVNIMAYTEKTKELQKDICDTIHKHNPTLIEGASTLLLIAAGHLKDSNMNKEDFLILCEVIFNGSELTDYDSSKMEVN